MNTQSNELISVVIPFDGFYESWSSSMLDEEIEQHNEYCESEEGEGSEPYDEDKLNWALVHDCYAKKYTESLFDWIENEESIDGGELKYEFEEMTSPREYNFSTDVISVKMALSEIIRLHDYVMDNYEFELRDNIKCQLEPCDGFMPFYDNDLDSWGDVKDWDAIQYKFLFNALGCMEDDGYPLVYNIMDSERGNGGMYECIEAGLTETN